MLKKLYPGLTEKQAIERIKAFEMRPIDCSPAYFLVDVCDKHIVLIAKSPDAASKRKKYPKKELKFVLNLATTFARATRVPCFLRTGAMVQML